MAVRAQIANLERKEEVYSLLPDQLEPKLNDEEIYKKKLEVFQLTNKCKITTSVILRASVDLVYHLDKLLTEKEKFSLSESDNIAYAKRTCEVGDFEFDEELWKSIFKIFNTKE